MSIIIENVEIIAPAEAGGKYKSFFLMLCEKRKSTFNVLDLSYILSHRETDICRIFVNVKRPDSAIHKLFTSG
jgi:hypothetical protein